MINIHIVIILIILVYFSYTYFIIPNKIKKLDDFTINIDLSDNKDITKISTKIIYWIVNNKNETYNNYTMNGIVNIDNHQIKIKIKDFEQYSNLDLKYYIINETELGENINTTIFTIKIK